MEDLRRELRGFPDSMSINITAAATGATYTAPEDGWVNFIRTATAVGQHITLMVGGNTASTAVIANSCIAGAATSVLCTHVPVSKGQVVTITWSAAGTLGGLHFVPTKKI